MEKETLGNEFEKTRSGQVDGLSPSDASSGISSSRRRFSRLSLGATPIVISLVSKPVLGAQCLSNMLSGNLSDPNRGNCSLGTSPGGWGNPGGGINGVSDAIAWAQTGYNYGTYNSNLKNNCNESQADCYEGGSKVSNLPSLLLTSSGPNKPLRKVLISTGDTLNRDRHVLAAYLNAKFSENSGGSFHYILTTAQVIGLANGSIPLPPTYMSLNSFLDSTWK